MILFDFSQHSGGGVLILGNTASEPERQRGAGGNARRAVGTEPERQRGAVAADGGVARVAIPLSAANTRGVARIIFMCMSTGEPGDTGEPARAALDAAYAQVLPRLRRLVAGLGFGPADADDILQSAYASGAERPGAYLGPAAAEAWWQRVTINACLLEYRRRTRFDKAASTVRHDLERAAAPGSPGSHPGAAGGLIRAEELERVRTALVEMDETLAVPLVLRYWCEMNATEIGGLLDLPPATVRTRLRTARLWLADRLGPQE